MAAQLIAHCWVTRAPTSVRTPVSVPVQDRLAGERDVVGNGIDPDALDERAAHHGLVDVRGQPGPNEAVGFGPHPLSCGDPAGEVAELPRRPGRQGRRVVLGAPVTDSVAECGLRQTQRSGQCAHSVQADPVEQDVRRQIAGHRAHECGDVDEGQRVDRKGVPQP
jgi:hypothetical protein